MAKINNLLIPNVSSLPSEKDKLEKSNKLNSGERSDFKNLVESLSKQERTPEEFSISGHAAKRLQERNIDLDGNEYLKIKEGLNKLRHKGGHDSLIITNKAAYVVDVDKNMLVTAVDRNSMSENVFTKIDSTIFMM